MCKTLQPGIETRTLRRNLGQFPTGVAVVTTVTPNGEPVGMTINSFNSISLIPALVGWSIDRSANSYGVFSRTDKFAITVLNDSQVDIAKRFSERGADKFSGLNVDPTMPTVIPNASAWFQCQTFQRFLLGDHLMLVGLVVESAISQSPPLVFAMGDFHAFPSRQHTESLTATA